MPCPECEAKDKARKAAEENVVKLTGERDALKAQVETAKQAPTTPAQVPSLLSLIAHCESGECHEHADEWNQVKTKVLERIPKDYIISRAREIGMVEKPAEPRTIKVGIK